MKIKIDNQTSRPFLPARTEEIINKILETLPREHKLGIERIRLVDSIQDPRLRNQPQSNSKLPGLYHPKQGSKQAWIEIALDVLLPNVSLFKRFVPRLTFKANLATVIFSLVGQHHLFTFSHSVKKGKIEASVKEYTEKNIKKWNERENNIRSRLFKPLQPTLERWAKTLQRKANKKKRKI